MYIVNNDEIHTDSEDEAYGIAALLDYAGVDYGTYMDPLRGEHVFKVHSKEKRQSTENLWNGM